MKSLGDDYRKTRSEYNKAKDNKIESEISRLEKLMEENEKTIEQEEAKALANNGNNSFGLFLIASNISSYDYEKLKSAIDKIAEPLLRTNLLKSIKQRLARLETVRVGAFAPDFTMPDTTGRNISLSQFRGKVVVIDCWASWCGPCRQESPNMVKLNNTYKDKDFVLLGVSFDKKRENWIKAINADKLEWTHISDLKNWECQLNELYVVNSIPDTFVVDKDGRIAARGLRSDELITKVGELLK